MSGTHRDFCFIVIMMLIIIFFLLLYSLSEIPECHVLLAMRIDVIHQVLAIALHPAYDCTTAIVSVTMILNLTQSPEAHTYIVQKEIVEKMLEICEKKQKIVSECASQSQQGDSIAVSTLKYVTTSIPAPFSVSFLSYACTQCHYDTHAPNIIESMRLIWVSVNIILFEYNDTINFTVATSSARFNYNHLLNLPLFSLLLPVE